MKSKIRIVANLIFALILLSIIFLKGLIPIESLFLSQIIIYIFWLLLVFVGVRIFYPDKVESFAFSSKNKVTKKIKRNARLIGLAIGIITNIAVIFLFDVDDYLKGYHIIQKP